MLRKLILTNCSDSTLVIIGCDGVVGSNLVRDCWFKAVRQKIIKLLNRLNINELRTPLGAG